MPSRKSEGHTFVWGRPRGMTLPARVTALMRWSARAKAVLIARARAMARVTAGLCGLKSIVKDHLTSG